MINLFQSNWKLQHGKKKKIDLLEPSLGGYLQAAWSTERELVSKIIFKLQRINLPNHSKA